MLRTHRPLMPTDSVDEPSVSPSSEFATLDDRALLTLILSRTMSAAASAATARRLLLRFASLGGVVAADPGEIARASTLDATKDLKLIREVAVRVSRAEVCHRPAISSWSAMLAYLRAALAHEPREQFRALYLDRRNILIQDEFVAADPTVQAAVEQRIERLLDDTAARIVAGRRRQGEAEATGSDADAGPA